ncbi:hypothetical protein KNE206_73210 [Kitasatospora sp. NE20-6]|uniref:alpha/beta hydrolase n=1 Tax=Kitasatospora sp. NE20-6 TaxID=2859066 RepID=UPI0034DCAB9B
MHPQPPRARARAARFRSLPAGAAALALAAAVAGCGSAAPSGSQDRAAARTAPGGPPGRGKVLMPSGPAAELTKARDTAAGPILLTTLHGAKSGVTGKVWVWLPPQYHDPEYASHGFPVLTLYAGGQSAGYNTWTDEQLPVQEIDARLAKEGRAHPFILVMPVQNLDAAESKALECSDIPGRPRMGTWMAEDVPDFVRANFRTVRGRDGWGLMGASTGAFCSAKLALQHPDVFRAAVPIDGYYDPDSPLWKGHEQERRANSPRELVAQGRADVRMLATAGGANTYETGLVKAWVKRAVPPVTVEYYEQPGGKHLTSDFGRMIPVALEWLSRNLTGPQRD